MVKFNNLIIIFFLFSHCSIDTKTGLWEDKNLINNDKKLTEINFNTELTFEDFKKNIVLYGKKSKYPKLMEK